MSARRPLRSLLVAVIALLAGGVSSPLVPSAQAAKPSVSIGDVNVANDSGVSRETASELGRTLRAELHAQLGTLTGMDRLERPLIVSATLTRLSSERRDDRTKTSVTISIALARADDRVLFAELRGRASAEEASSNLASVRRAALQGAVHGALARLPEAVRRSR